MHRWEKKHYEETPFANADNRYWFAGRDKCERATTAGHRAPG